jgi:hypothetical protein
MLRVCADFNDRAEDGSCWNLWFQHSRLGEQINQLDLGVGQKILLYQDEDDFEVVATLDYKYVQYIGRNEWVAQPDWSTLFRK